MHVRGAGECVCRREGGWRDTSLRPLAVITCARKCTRENKAGRACFWSPGRNDEAWLQGVCRVRGREHHHATRPIPQIESPVPPFGLLSSPW
jgi:hypothetical protein